MDGRPRGHALCWLRSGQDDDRGQMRYQLIQLIQLLFALSLIFGAFIGGVTVGWWRWGRGKAAFPRGRGDRSPGPGTLFSPEGRDDEIVLAEIDLDITDAVITPELRGGEGPVFTPGPLGAGGAFPQRLIGLPPTAIGSPSDRHSADVEALEA